MRVLLLGLVLLLSQFSWGQKVAPKGVPEEGTFQFIVKDSKIKWDFTIENLIGTEEKRKKNESVAIKIYENTVLYLPSKNEINSPGFKKLEPVIYE